MARMLGVCQRGWCPACRRPAGLDCPSTSRGKSAARAAEKRAWRGEDDVDVDDRPTLIRATRAELEAQRAALLAEVGMDYETLRDCAEAWQLRADELDIWHTIQGIDYLLDANA